MASSLRKEKKKTPTTKNQKDKRKKSDGPRKFIHTHKTKKAIENYISRK